MYFIFFPTTARAFMSSVNTFLCRILLSIKKKATPWAFFLPNESCFAQATRHTQLKEIPSSGKLKIRPNLPNIFEREIIFVHLAERHISFVKKNILSHGSGGLILVYCCYGPRQIDPLQDDSQWRQRRWDIDHWWEFYDWDSSLFVVGTSFNILRIKKYVMYTRTYILKMSHPIQ